MKQIKELIKPLSVWQFLFYNLLLSVIIAFFFMRGANSDPIRILIGFVWSFSICITQWTGPLFINRLLDKRYKWIDVPVKRTFIEIFSMLLWSVTAFMTVQFIMYFLVLGITPTDAWQSIRQSIFIAFSISLFISLVFTAIGFFKAWRKSILNEAELKSQMMSYKYEALRNQINPHFLFNSFNVLSDLVYDDQAQAVKFIRQMSDLFRYVIDSRDKELVTLEEEMNFLNSYTYLLKTRFGDKLNLKIRFLPQASELIVPMTLQLLVENAVKHNEVSERFPLSVEIRRNNNYIEVENSLRKKNVGEDSKNTGLKNISQQYSFFTEKEIEVTHDETSFLVRIPLIQSAEK
jgi:sensor histidine kinase YesM